MFEYVEPGMFVINIIGVGHRCENIVEGMAKTVAALTCLENCGYELSNLSSFETGELCNQDALSRRLVDGDISLIILLIDPEDRALVEKALLIAEAGRKADAFSIAVVSPGNADSGCGPDNTQAARALIKSGVDSCVDIAHNCLVSFDDIASRIIGKSTLADYLIRFAGLQIAQTITTRSMMCYEFEDIASVLQGPGTVHMGIGIASHGNKAFEAVERAIAGLANQGLDIALADGMLVVLTGAATYMNMHDYDNVHQCIHESVHECCDIKLKPFFDNELGDNLRVAIFARFPDDTPAVSSERRLYPGGLTAP